jgi:2,4-dienoyl-CoA reductase-like NADH-dependent reductase (Old Yellow Enzyme family)
VKSTQADFQKGGFQHEEALVVAKWLEEEGIDLLELSGGNYESPTICCDSGMLNTAGEEELGVIRESTRKREAYVSVHNLCITCA